MRTRSWFLIAAFLLRCGSGGFAQEPGDTPREPHTVTSPTIKAASYGFDLLDIGRVMEDKLSFQLSGTLQSKHIWHGFDLMDDHGVFFPVATATLADTGLSAKIIGAYGIGTGVDRRDELNGALFYSRDLLPETRYATHSTLNYFYYGKPRQPSRRADAQEIGMSLSWPKLLGDRGLVPNYYFGSLWPSESDSLVRNISGFLHVFGLAYEWEMPGLRSDGRLQPLRLAGDVTYNDGFGGAGHGWSHMALGVSTNLSRAGLGITPALYYQVSLDHLVNVEDELWAGVTFSYSF